MNSIFKENLWNIKAEKYEFIKHKGKLDLYLEQGTALLKNVTFKNGIIDYDVSFEQGRKFAMIQFRISDSKNYYYTKKRQIKQLNFGFSDEVTVFVNNKKVYSGQNKFKSRDYSYLRTIGFFDAIYLDLKKGKKEIVFAVSENMGGWGLKAKLGNLENFILE